MGKTRKDRKDFDKDFNHEFGNENKKSSRKRNRNRENFNEFRNASVDDVLKDFEPVGGND